MQSIRARRKHVRKQDESDKAPLNPRALMQLAWLARSMMASISSCSTCNCQVSIEATVPTPTEPLCPYRHAMIEVLEHSCHLIFGQGVCVILIILGKDLDRHLDVNALSYSVFFL